MLADSDVVEQPRVLSSVTEQEWQKQAHLSWMSAARTPIAPPQWVRGDPGELMCPCALGPMVGVGPRTLSSSWPGCFISTLLSLALAYLCLCSPHTGSQLDIFVQGLHLSVTSSCTWWPSPSTLQIIMSELRVIKDPCRCLTTPNMHMSSRTVTATSVK